MILYIREGSVQYITLRVRQYKYSKQMISNGFALA